MKDTNVRLVVSTASLPEDPTHASRVLAIIAEKERNRERAAHIIPKARDAATKLYFESIGFRTRSRACH